jgi:hypothetical protein
MIPKELARSTPQEPTPQGAQKCEKLFRCE